MIVSGLSLSTVDHAHPQLLDRPTRAGAFKVRSQIALEPLLRKRTGMAQQAQPDRAIEHDRAAACRIAGRTGERSGYNVADDPVREQLFGKSDCRPR